MKVYGPFHALSNPLVAISLGLRGAEDALQVYDRYKEAHKDDFLTKALLTGQPVTEMEGGPFRQLASKVTGGLIHPNVEASGEQLASEILGLRRQEGENIKEASSVANIRKNVGGEPFKAGTPLAKTALRLGLGDISGPTASETKEQQLAQTKTPEAAAERATAIFNATAPLKLSLAKSMEEAKLPLVRETSKARAMGVRDAYLASPAFMDAKGGHWINPDTMRPPPPNVKVSDAEGMGYTKLTDTGVKFLDSGHSALDLLEEVRAAANRRLVSTQGKSPGQATASVAANWLALKASAYTGTDKDASTLATMGNVASIDVIYNIQHRFANKIDLTAFNNLLGTSGRPGHGITGVSKEIANQRIDIIENTIRKGMGLSKLSDRADADPSYIGAAVEEGIHEMSTTPSER